MDNLNIICTVIGTSVAIVGCLGTYMRYLFKKTERDAVNRKRLDDMEERMRKSPCESHSEDITKHKEKIARIDKVIEKLDKLPCESHATDLTEHKERIARLDRLIEKLDKLPCESHATDLAAQKENIKRLDLLIEKQDKNLTEQREEFKRMREESDKKFSEQINSMNELFKESQSKLSKLPCESHALDIAAHKERITRLDRLIEKLDKLPCEGHKESISENRRTIDRITSTLNENKEMLVRLSKWAMKVDNSLIDSLSVKCSPMRMTKSGEHLYKLSGADKALDKMKEKLIEGIENASPRTEYDVEDLAYEMLIRNMGDIALDQVKRFVYYAPDKLHIEETGEDIRFDLYSILRLMGIRLRDMYLETHRELVSESGH